MHTNELNRRTLTGDAAARADTAIYPGFSNDLNARIRELTRDDTDTEATVADTDVAYQDAINALTYGCSGHGQPDDPIQFLGNTNGQEDQIGGTQVPPDLQGTSGLPGDTGIPQRNLPLTEVALPGTRTGDIEQGYPLPPHARSVRKRTKDNINKPKKVRLERDTPEHQTHTKPDACMPDLEVPQEGAYQNTPVGDRTKRVDTDNVGTSQECPDTTRSLFPNEHPAKKRPRGEGTKKRIEPQPIDSTPVLAMLLDTVGTKHIPVYIHMGTNGLGQDEMGYRPIQISFIGIPPGRPQTIQARPARWNSLRRHVFHQPTGNYRHPSNGLRASAYDQCETWECYYPGECKENNNFQRAVDFFHTADAARATSGRETPRPHLESFRTPIQRQYVDPPGRDGSTNYTSNGSQLGIHKPTDFTHI